MIVPDLKHKNPKTTQSKTLGEDFENLLSHEVLVVSREDSVRLIPVFALRLKSFNKLFMLEVSFPTSEAAVGKSSCIGESNEGGLNSTRCTSFERGFF